MERKREAQVNNDVCFGYDRVKIPVRQKHVKINSCYTETRKHPCYTETR